MFGRILLASVVAGLVAGIVLTAVQWVAVTPLIQAAETYEAGIGDGAAPHSHGELSHAHASGGSVHRHEGRTLVLSAGGRAPAGGDGSASARGHGHDAAARALGDAWAPADGIERMVWTGISNVATAIGFALLIVAVFTWRGGATLRQGLLWGAAGFVVFFANPAIGLHPEIPGTLAGDLPDRQLWWLFAVACSGAGVGLLLLVAKVAAKIGGAVLLAVPHLVGAPHPGVAGGLAPRELAQEFVAASAVANAIFWVVLGLAVFIVFSRFARR